MKKINIGLIYPSRGLLYTETFKEVLENLKPYKHTIYWSHGNTLPDCFNKPLSEALRGSHSHIWIIEDDMVLPKDILKRLIEADEDVIACDYPLVEQPSGTVLYDKDDQAIFSGTGCMLCKREIFKKMPRPVFTSSIAWEFCNYGGKARFTAKDIDPDIAYGFHDITFGLHRYLLGKPIKIYPEVLKQRKMIKKGDNNNNDGTDKIILYDNYKKITMNLIPERPVTEKETDKLCNVIIDGKPTLVSREMLKRLEAKGVVGPVKIDYGNIIVDTNSNKEAIKYFKGETK